MSLFEDIVEDWKAAAAAELSMIAHLDFEAPLICEKAEGCDQRAIALVRSRCCAVGCTLCSGHLEALRIQVDSYRQTLCNRCGATGHSFDEVVEVVPIKDVTR